MNFPGWLLRIIIAFISNTKMTVRYRGKLSTEMNLPGGKPQGTLLSLLLFLVLVNDIGFNDQKNDAGEIATSKRNMKELNLIHLKFVDDLTLAESINLPEKLNILPESEIKRPETYHERTGHSLPESNSQVFNQLSKILDYTKENQMKLNFNWLCSILVSLLTLGPILNWLEMK